MITKEIDFIITPGQLQDTWVGRVAGGWSNRKSTVQEGDSVRAVLRAFVDSYDTIKVRAAWKLLRDKEIGELLEDPMSIHVYIAEIRAENDEGLQYTCGVGYKGALETRFDGNVLSTVLEELVQYTSPEDFGKRYEVNPELPKAIQKAANSPEDFVLAVESNWEDPWKKI